MPTIAQSVETQSVTVMTDWSPQQDRALMEFRRWLRDRDQQVFKLFGVAGSGKTELAREIGMNVRGDAAFCSFTGKAAFVMRQHGCRPCSTIHRLIYRAYQDEDDRWFFKLRGRHELSNLALIIVDEASMVDRSLARDLLSFDRPLLVIGDPAQLPPVSDEAAYFMGEPDVMLTEIHRQAAENPILYLADRIRRGKALPRPGYKAGNTVRIIADDGNDEDYDVTLVGLNDTRHWLNRRQRA